MLRYESAPGVRTEAGEQGPLWGCDRVGVHKNAIVPMRIHPAPGVGSQQVGASEGGRGALNLFGDLTPKMRVGPASKRSWPASRSHPQRGLLLRVALVPPPPYAGAPGVVRALPEADFAGFPASSGVPLIVAELVFPYASVSPAN